jgi:hypothetical protein
MFLIIGEPFPVLLVDAEGDLLEFEYRLQSVEEFEELIEVLLLYELVPPVTGLALGCVHEEVRQGRPVLEIGRKATPTSADNTGLAYDFHDLLDAQGLDFFEATLL